MTDRDEGRGAPRFLGRPIPPSFRGRVIVIPRGGTRPFEEEEWRGSIVLIEEGEVELECVGGARGTFRRGAILWLDGLGLCRLRQRGPDPVVLVAVLRHRSDPEDAP